MVVVHPMVRSAGGGQTVATEESNSYLVVAFFDEVKDGESAARSIADLGRLEGTVSESCLLGMNPDGQVGTTHVAPANSLGNRSVIGVVAEAITGGVLPRRPQFLDTDSDLLTDDIVRFSALLESGCCAVAFVGQSLVARQGVVALADLGGKAEMHKLSAGVLQGRVSG